MSASHITLSDYPRAEFSARDLVEKRIPAGMETLRMQWKMTITHMNTG